MTAIYFLSGILLISIINFTIVKSKEIRIRNKLKVIELEKIQEDKRQKEHTNWIARGFKLYQWRSEYFRTEKNYYREDFGQRFRYENQGRGYFRNEEEIRRWLHSHGEILTFCREL